MDTDKLGQLLKVQCETQGYVEVEEHYSHTSRVINSPTTRITTLSHP